jgi:hypothetical protein
MTETDHPSQACSAEGGRSAAGAERQREREGETVVRVVLRQFLPRHQTPVDGSRPRVRMTQGLFLTSRDCEL